MTPWDVVWIVVGVVILVATLVDAFLAVLNYDEAGLFVNGVVRTQWIVLRSITRRVRRRWRPVILRQVTGILVLSTILAWVLGIILGFTFIYLGAMGASGNFQISAGVQADFFGALYLSTGQFATVGVDNISPGDVVFDMLTVSEAMINVLVLSFLISFLGSVYGVVQSLRAFSANFFQAGRGIANPTETLEPYFPDGVARGLDGHLGSILDSLSAYSDGLAQNPVAYYFQSGREQFSLPYALYMTSGVTAALRWGLPTGSDPAKEPDLIRLVEAFDDFRVHLLRMRRRTSPATPDPVSPDDFTAAVAVFEGPESNASLDPWVLRFLTVQRRVMTVTQTQGPVDPADAHRRYVQWLPFDFQAQWLLAVISRDLDYQPVFRDVAATPDGIPLDDPRAWRASGPTPSAEPPTSRTPRPSRIGAWVRRRHLLIDPGWVRLTDALRTLAAVVLAVALSLPVSQLLGAEAATGAVFAGLVALFSAPATTGAAASAPRWAMLLTAVPVLVGLTLGALLPKDVLTSSIAIAVVAAAAAWARRFGPKWGGLGQLAFITFFFTTLTGVEPGAVAGAAVASLMGLLADWVVRILPRPSVQRQVDGGIGAVYTRVGMLLDTMIDLVASGRQDTRLLRAVRSERVALERTVGSLNRPLDQFAQTVASPQRAHTLRVRVFDVQLAAENLGTVIPAASRVDVSVPQRARLASDLLALREEVAVVESSEYAARDGGEPRDIEEWPIEARRVSRAASELRSAVERLRRVQVADDKVLEDILHRELPGVDVAEMARSDREAARAAAASAMPPQQPATAGFAPADRQAVQAGLSTALALYLGGLVSSGHEYWAAMPAFQVLSGSDGETRLKAIQRIIATVAGSGVAFGLAILAGHDPLWAFPLLLVGVFFALYVRSISPAAMSFWMTIVLASMYDVLGKLTVETVQVRLLETAIGATVAIVISALILPTRTGTRVLDGMTDLLGRAHELADAAFARVLGRPSPPDRVALGVREREVSRRLTQLETLAQPLLRNPGSQQRTGIDTQLTALRSLLYYERHLGRELAGIDPGVPGSPDWAALAQATDENFDAARAVLAGRLPARVHLPDEFETDAGTAASPRYAGPSCS
ncbi:FUSC family protein [Microbacterium lushaniae]|uniref:Integral membrane bound transporter domain-containing protein n=1 Tax=Microbacterium lushaniae TaxID=2614639 RepID=A0A5J6L6P5_9MICO|nr:FUSC family protein [Microbacterium lushaniae]QEW04138.1 hypothetical protein F6J85_14280 [Microbacterium lushaniae]